MKNYEEDPDVELNVVHIGASEKKKPYPELKTTNHAICKSITEGKVKEWPLYGRSRLCAKQLKSI
jgi:hypothetical protein